MTYLLIAGLALLAGAAIAREWAESKSRGIAMSIVVAIPLLVALIWGVLIWGAFQ